LLPPLLLLLLLLQVPPATPFAPAAGQNAVNATRHWSRQLAPLHEKMAA